MQILFWDWKQGRKYQNQKRIKKTLQTLPIFVLWIIEIISQIYCFRERPVEQFYGRPVDSSGRPIEILLNVQQKFLLHFSMKLAILRHLKQTCKILEDVASCRILQPTRHPVESNGRPLDQTSRPIYDCIVTFLTINCCHSIWI